MRFLKTNTATIVTVGPFYDKTDGVVIESTLTIANERISATVDLNDGSAPTLVLDNVTGATSGTDNDLNYIANCDAGLMQLELAAADVNYLGRFFLTITDSANHVPVFHEFMIISAQMWDAMFGTGNLNADVVNWKGGAAPAMTGDAYNALVVATYPEPGQEAPPATTNLVTKIGYLYKFLRNKITQTADTLSVFNAAGTVVDHKATTSDDDVTYTRGEIGTGP